MPRKSWKEFDPAADQDVDLFAVEFTDVSQPLLEIGSEGGRGIGVGECICGNQGQVDPAKQQKVAQAVGSSGGIDGQQAKSIARAERGCHVMGHPEITGARSTAEDHQGALVVLPLQRLLQGVPALQRLLLGRHGVLQHVRGLGARGLREDPSDQREEQNGENRMSRPGQGGRAAHRRGKILARAWIDSDMIGS